MRNNNGEVLRLLSRRLYRANLNRNRVLTCAVAFVVLLIFSVFSLSAGKLEADCLLYARMMGTTASTTLERATEEQIAVIENLDYIKAVGKEVYIGETEAFTCLVLDETAYETMQAPAYSDIHGVYPKEADEVMLPMRALSDLGIAKPHLGMEIDVTMQTTGGQRLQQTFRLSGYYTEYVEAAKAPPYGFFSERFLEKEHLASQQHTTLLIKQQDSLDGETAEDRLYQDVEMTDDTQQFFGGNALTYSAIYEFAGGFDVAVILAIVIFAGAWLLLYNIMSISMVEHVRQYGLLKTLGTTKGQLARIVYRQTGWIVCKGCLLGMAAGMAMTVFIVPKLLENLYLHEFGSASAMIAFKPWILVFAVGFGVYVTFAATSLAMMKVISMQPIEAVKFVGLSARRRKKQKPGNQRFSLALLACRNLFRYRKRFVIAVISLTLSMTVFLSAVVLSTGLDQTAQIEYDNQDFSIMCGASAMTAEDYTDDEIHFDPDFAQELLDLPGVTEAETVDGGFGRVKSSETALSMRLASWNLEHETFLPFVVQTLHDDMLEELAMYVEEKELSEMVDMDAVRKGKGFIVLHYHNLSQTMEEKSKEAVGQPVQLFSLAKDRKNQMECSGYLDFTAKGFPNMMTTWNGPSILYFLVSEEGFARMELPERIFRLDFDVELASEPLVKAQAERMVSAYNRAQKKLHPADLQYEQGILEITAKSDLLMAARDYIGSSRVIMGGICLVLLSMGLLNYINVTLTGLTARRKEFAVMESLGMTRKQLRKSIVLEGIFYSLIVTGLTLTAGSGVLYGMRQLVNQRIAYFTFSYPWAALLCGVMFLFAICIVIPLVLQKKTVRDSVIERLRMYT